MTTVHGGQAQRWTADRLRSRLNELYAGESVVVLANREPFSHERTRDGQVGVRRTASGLVTALEPLLLACHGTWVAHGSGTADAAVVDRTDGLNVPPRNPAYRLRRVWLTAEEERRYYYGFANEGLWPLCHRVHVRPTFRAADFVAYAQVNERFAAAVCEEATGPTPVVLVQDYHFALAPQMIRARVPAATIISFWHIPWPSPREFEICPWEAELVRGLLGSDVVGFHTEEDCHQFLDVVERCPDVEVDRTSAQVWSCGQCTIVRPYPISIEWPSTAVRAAAPVNDCRIAVRRQLGSDPESLLIVGVDRLDYTKGIVEKALAVERLLERFPEFQGRVTFLQVAEPSRVCIAAYRDLRARVEETVQRINLRFGGPSHQPIVLRDAHHEPDAVCELLRAADVCYVGSLHDGMNLVAKEFVAARDDERGVLVLSAFAGAARQLTPALLLNPYAIEDAAQVLARGLRMGPGEQATRMQAMRTIVAQFNSYWWAGQMLQDAARFRHPAQANRSPAGGALSRIPAMNPNLRLVPGGRADVLDRVSRL